MSHRNKPWTEGCVFAVSEEKYPYSMIQNHFNMDSIKLFNWKKKKSGVSPFDFPNISLLSSIYTSLNQPVIQQPIIYKIIQCSPEEEL